jgi:hypothetical protein
MPSNIDPLYPEAGAATTQSVRDNFSAAKTEIEALQTLLEGLTDGWSDFSEASTIVGFSSFVTKIIWYIDIGPVRVLYFFISGTSNSTGLSFTLPGTNQSGGILSAVTRNRNNSAGVAAGYCDVESASDVVNCYQSAGAGFTASGNKAAIGLLIIPLPA